MPARIDDGLTSTQRYRLRHGDELRTRERAKRAAMDPDERRAKDRAKYDAGGIERSRRYIDKHRDEINAKARDEYALNPTPMRDRKRDQMARLRSTPEGRAIHAARERVRRATNPEHVRELERGYYAIHGLDKSHRRRGWLLDAPKRVTAKDWRRLVARYDGRCAYCGATGRLERDHIIPLKRGGRHAIGNLIPACSRCNRSKNARLLVEWRNHRRAAVKLL